MKRWTVKIRYDGTDGLLDTRTVWAPTRSKARGAGLESYLNQHGWFNHKTVYAGETSPVTNAQDTASK